MFFEYLAFGMSLCIVTCLFYVNEKGFFLEREIDDASGAKSSDAVFRCNLCERLPNSPIVSFCGHIFCWSCYNVAYNKTVKRLYCPSCFNYNNVNFFTPIYDCSTSKSDDDERRPHPATFDGIALKFVNHRASLFSKLKDLSLQEFIAIEGVHYTSLKIAITATLTIFLIFVFLLLSHYD